MPRYIPEDILLSDLRRIAHRFDELFDQKAVRGVKVYLGKREVSHMFEILTKRIRKIADTYGSTD